MLLGFILFALIPISIVSFFIYLPIWLLRRKKEGKLSFWCHFVRYTLIGCIASLLCLTIFWGGFGHASVHMLNLQPFIWVIRSYEMGYSEMIKQLLINILMFIPYGFLLPLALKSMQKWWRTDLLVFGSSFMIEFVQYFIGRSCDIDDLLMNTLGGCLGYGFFCLIRLLGKDKQWYKKLRGVSEKE